MFALTSVRMVTFTWSWEQSCTGDDKLLRSSWERHGRAARKMLTLSVRVCVRVCLQDPSPSHSQGAGPTEGRRLRPSLLQGCAKRGTSNGPPLLLRRAPLSGGSSSCCSWLQYASICVNVENWKIICERFFLVFHKFKFKSI